MNTPKTPKRHKVDLPESVGVGGTGVYALDNPEIAAAFGQFVAAFEHVENTLSYPLAILLGGYDTITAGYVLRAIRNPKTKQDLMWHLLQKAPVNKVLPELFDHILSEYETLARIRNNYVHGKWFTKYPSYDVFVSPTDDHGLDIFAAQPINVKALNDLTDRSQKLSMLIIIEVLPMVEERRKAQAPQKPTDEPTL